MDYNSGHSPAECPIEIAYQRHSAIKRGRAREIALLLITRISFTRHVAARPSPIINGRCAGRYLLIN